MLIKNPDDQSEAIKALELQVAANGPDAARAKVELRNRQAGLRGEKEAAYLIDFDFAQSPNWAVIHDLRLEHRGRVAQIDHLLINRWLQVYVLETKHFHAGVKITDEGEFLRWNDFAKRYEGMPSPISQNERHIAVLRDVFETIDMPTRAGFRIPPEFVTFILVSPKARIDRPRRFDSSRVIKADQLKSKIWRDIDGENSLIGMFKTVAKIVSSDTVAEVARNLVRKHRPAGFASAPTFAASSPVIEAPHPAPPTITPKPKPKPKPERAASAPAAKLEAPKCKGCSGQLGAVLYGRFSYYFKCSGCGTNTAIRFQCLPGHEPRLRKDGLRFFRECAQCGSSDLYFTNAAG